MYSPRFQNFHSVFPHYSYSENISLVNICQISREVKMLNRFLSTWPWAVVRGRVHRTHLEEPVSL